MQQGRALPPGTLIANQWRIERMLGEGGFGVTYEARHKDRGDRIALKEYLPHGCGSRIEGTSKVRSAPGRDGEIFQWGLERFLKEAETLARFDHPSIVRVTEVMQANDTAYMALAYEQGGTLNAWLRSLGRAPTQDEMDRLVWPLTDALREVHSLFLLHRDIKPDNILMRPDGTPVLIDFGATKVALASRNQSRTGGITAPGSSSSLIVVSDGFSPPEQYATGENLQGPWTDVYALAATMYRAITGVSPPNAPTRMLQDTHKPLRSLASPNQWRRQFVTGVDHALAVRSQDRPQSAVEFRRALGLTDPVSRPRSQPIQPAGPSRAEDRVAFHPGNARVEPAAAQVAPATGVLSGLAGLAQAQSLLARIGGASGTSGTSGTPSGSPSLPSSPQSAPPTASRNLALAAIGALLLVGTGVAFYGLGARGGAVTSTATVQGQPSKGPPATSVASQQRTSASRGNGATAAPTSASDFKELCEVLASPTGERRGQTGVAFGDIEGAKAAAACEEAVKFYPNNSRLQALLARSMAASKRYIESRETAQKAAERGDGLAMALLGALHANGLGGAADATAARIWYEKGAAKGDPAALRNFGIFLENGSGGLTADAVRAREHFERAIDKGDVLAHVHLGLLYEAGKGGLQRDFIKARELYEKAAAKGDAEAMRLIGLMHSNGTGAAQDWGKARELFEKSAAKGNSTAMRHIGFLYQNGNGVPQDYVKAREWWQQAAARNDAVSMRSIGWLFDNGNGVTQDHVKAREWYEKAAARGDSSAINNLGALYGNGRGVRQDFAKAREHYEKAAQLGNAVAMRNLGFLHQHGRGATRSCKIALEWYQKAINAGNAQARSSHEALAKTCR